MHIDVAVAKVPKYAYRVSGDTLEMIERPHGGISFVLADGQGSGPGAKYLSHLVATKAVALLADGVRDGAAARATHDFLYAYRQGKVSAELTIVSIDLVSKTIVLSRNSHCPLLICADDELRLIEQPSQPIGVYARTKPVVTEMPLAPDLAIIVVSDGVLSAGECYGQRLDLMSAVRPLMVRPFAVQDMADGLLSQAVALDRGQPQDDTSVLVLATRVSESEDATRRLHMSLPIDV